MVVCPPLISRPVICLTALLLSSDAQPPLTSADYGEDTSLSLVTWHGAGRKLKDGYNTWCGDAICGVTVQSGSARAAAGAGSGGMPVSLTTLKHKHS